MTDTTTAEANDDTGDGQESSVIKDLRKQLKALTAERDELRAGARQRAFVDAGITEAGRKAMDRLYDGDLDADAIRSFAEDNGITVAAATDDAPAGDTQPGVTPSEVSPDEQARRAAQDRIGQAGALGNPPPPQDPLSELNQKIEKATADGDMTTVLRLNSEKAQRLRTAAGV